MKFENNLNKKKNSLSTFPTNSTFHRNYSLSLSLSPFHFPIKINQTPSPQTYQTTSLSLSLSLSLSYQKSVKRSLSNNKPTMRRVLLLLFSISSFLHFVAGGAAATAAVSMNAYDVLRANGLPAGLLPKGVSDFTIDDDGRFEARLAAPCTVKFESRFRYNATVSGTISPGEIAGLLGVSIKDLFMWFPVNAIRLDGLTDGVIHFDVGVVDKRYPVSLFEVPPDCASDSSPLPDVRSRAGLLAFQSQLNSAREVDQEDKAGRVVI